MKTITLAHSDLTKTIYAIIGKEKIDITNQAIAEVKAINALEQEPKPCEDCVSRQAVIEYIKDCDAELMHDIENESVREDILNMPSVTPKIPTSDDCVSRQAVIDKKELIELPDGQSFYSIDPEDIINIPLVTPTHGTCEDCISRAEVMTEIQLNAKRYSLAKECESLGQVVWSDNLISINDVLDVIRALPPVTPKQDSKQGQ